MDPISFEIPIDRAWGFFNAAHTKEGIGRHLPPYIIRPFPDKLFKAVGDNTSYYRSYKFDNYWRFDLLRPLYGRGSDYFREFLYLITSPIIVLDILKVAYRLLTEARYKAKRMIPVILFLTIPALIYAILITALSMILSLLGLLIRPIMTLLLGTNDPDLKIKYECDCNHIKYDNDGTPYVDVAYTFIKGDIQTSYGGTIKWNLPLTLPEGTRLSASISKYKIIVHCEDNLLKWNAAWDTHKFEHGNSSIYKENAAGEVKRDWIEECLKAQMSRRKHDLEHDERKVARHERAMRLFDKGGEKQIEYENYVQASERQFWRT